MHRLQRRSRGSGANQELAAGWILHRISVSSIGIIFDSHLRFGNPRAGQSTSLAIQFRLTNDVSPLDQVQLGFPGLFLPPTFQKSFFTDSQVWTQAQWSLLPPENIPTITLLASAVASGTEAFEVVIPSCYRLTMFWSSPCLGLQARIKPGHGQHQRLVTLLSLLLPARTAESRKHLELSYVLLLCLKRTPATIL